MAWQPIRNMKDMLIFVVRDDWQTLSESDEGDEEYYVGYEHHRSLRFVRTMPASRSIAGGGGAAGGTEVAAMSTYNTSKLYIMKTLDKASYECIGPPGRASWRMWSA